MPGNTKKTPATQKKKASTHGQVSIKKIKKAHLDQEDSFLCQPVSTVFTSSPYEHLLSAIPQPGSSDMVLAMLTQIQASNQQLADRMSKLEQQQLFNSSSNTTDHSHSSQRVLFILQILVQYISLGDRAAK